ncbi:hypothetical protein SDJN03_15822, partial [Cucurbita argyrosperma subsp. sororia]
MAFSLINFFTPHYLLRPSVQRRNPSRRSDVGDIHIDGSNDGAAFPPAVEMFQFGHSRRCYGGAWDYDDRFYPGDQARVYRETGEESVIRMWWRRIPAAGVYYDSGGVFEIVSDPVKRAGLRQEDLPRGRVFSGFG